MWRKGHRPLYFFEKFVIVSEVLFDKGKLMPQTLSPDVNPDYVVLINGVYYDLCVFCKANTGVRNDYPVPERTFHVDGSGQLCQNCWNKTYSRV